MPMDSPQSVISPFKEPSVYAEPERRSLELFTLNRDCFFGENEGFLGVLEVYIHHARDIHNICIYQNQDVYAKLCLTSDPDNTLSTQIINGGGRNPVFNEKFRLKVQTVDSSLKCEIWMLSRVRNYLEDQLLGFALVPISELLIKNGKLEKEFSLSSTELFHSPAGFVQLSLSYNGHSPEVIAIPALSTSKATTETELHDSVLTELEKLEFPDPKTQNENHLMVSEYFGMSVESVVSSDTENQASSKTIMPFTESFSTENSESVEILKHDSPESSVSTNESSVVSFQSSETPNDSKSPIQENVSPTKEKTADVGDITKPLITINIEPEQKVVQQDFVDLYMKSMQQFTDSLAKMKLPMDMESESTSSVTSSLDQKPQTPKNGSSRVFYGSRAFF